MRLDVAEAIIEEFFDELDRRILSEDIAPATRDKLRNDKPLLVASLEAIGKIPFAQRVVNQLADVMKMPELKKWL